MRKFKEGDSVYVVTDFGVVKAKVFHVAPKTGTYSVVYYTMMDGNFNKMRLWDVDASKVYTPDDYGRACNYFEFRYGHEHGG